MPPRPPTRSFYLTSTATFIARAQTRATGRTKPYPPLVTHVPEYIFYPFVTSGAQRLPAAGGVATLCTVAALLALLV